jgi:hypothetical protein
LWEIQKREGESAWEYNQKFKDIIGRLAHMIHERMVYSRITTSDNNSFNATTDSHVNISLGEINEDRSHGRLSSKYENDQASSRYKFVATSGINICSNRKDSRINHAKTRTPLGLVQRMLHRRASRK